MKTKNEYWSMISDMETPSYNFKFANIIIGQMTTLVYRSTLRKKKQIALTLYKSQPGHAIIVRFASRHVFKEKFYFGEKCSNSVPISVCKKTEDLH